MIQLSEKWAKQLTTQPETGMGYQVATVFLKDGRRFDQVMIVGGNITSVKKNPMIPFVEEDIDRIVVTHEK